MSNKISNLYKITIKKLILIFFMIYIIKVVKKMDYTSVFIVINYFCLGNTQRIIYLAHGICLEMKENYVVPLIR